MLTRQAVHKLRDMASKFPVIAVTGPRQSGKTTMCRELLFPGHAYVSLENPDMREYAQDDPKGFLDTHGTPLIIDEAQHVPELFSYIQGIVDSDGRPGRYVLTGSHNFLLLERITQSLAGRVYVFHLLPLSYDELRSVEPGRVEEQMFLGGYPRLHDTGIAPDDFFPSYVRTYIERDVRSILNVTDLGMFGRFLQLCAGRAGQLFNATAIGNELGLDHKTVQRWLSVLEASFIVFRLASWHNNFSKRVVKTPKLYFYDTGLLCHLLGIRDAADVRLHFAGGAIFENWAILEVLKMRYNAGNTTPMYFWRDNTGNEIDLLLADGPRVSAIEMKLGATIRPDHFKGLEWFAKLAADVPMTRHIIYSGDQPQLRNGTQVIPWDSVSDIQR
jgi:predicted AAA+ superfamily ATPase